MFQFFLSFHPLIISVFFYSICLSFILSVFLLFYLSFFYLNDCWHSIVNCQFCISVAKMIWNNLLEPVNAKSNWNPTNRLRCPSKEHPYLMTDKNSDSDGNRMTDDDKSKPFERVGSSGRTGGVTRKRKRRKKTKRNSDEFESLLYKEDFSCNILWFVVLKLYLKFQIS